LILWDRMAFERVGMSEMMTRENFQCIAVQECNRDMFHNVKNR
jgi:hypothetical protein